jgi:hypothetical protein
MEQSVPKDDPVEMKAEKLIAETESNANTKSIYAQAEETPE